MTAELDDRCRVEHVAEVSRDPLEAGVEVVPVHRPAAEGFREANGQHSADSPQAGRLLCGVLLCRRRRSLTRSAGGDVIRVVDPVEHRPTIKPVGQVETLAHCGLKPNDTTAAITFVPSKNTGPPESPLHEPPLPFAALELVFRLKSVSPLAPSTRKPGAVSRSRNETITGSLSLRP
jgi:hypothetical protein